MERLGAALRHLGAVLERLLSSLETLMVRALFANTYKKNRNESEIKTTRARGIRSESFFRSQGVSEPSWSVFGASRAVLN